MNGVQVTQWKLPETCDFGELMRKLWNPRNFKAHVSPHEMLQAVVLCSKKNFQITKQGEGLWDAAGCGHRHCTHTNTNTDT